MSTHRAEISWKNTSREFTLGRYSRVHSWRFDGGIEVRASASPHVVRLPYSAEDAVDPEEAFVAALSSCHMLSFLSLAAKQKLTVESYEDHATGEMGKDDAGHDYIARVVLHPEIRFAGSGAPSPEEVAALHESAHHICFIANSVKTDVRCEPRSAVPPIES